MAWPDGQLRTDRAQLRHNAARFQWKEACESIIGGVAYLGADSGAGTRPGCCFRALLTSVAWSWVRRRTAKEKQDDLFRLQVRPRAELNKARTQARDGQAHEKFNQKF